MIYYQFLNELIIIDCSRISVVLEIIDGIDVVNEVGYFCFFDLMVNGEEYMEILDFIIIVDNLIVEVYVNDRFVLSIWVR